MMVGVNGNPCGRIPDEFSLATLHNTIVTPAKVFPHIVLGFYYSSGKYIVLCCFVLSP